MTKVERNSLQHELWVAKIAERSNLESQSVEKLFAALSRQLLTRLTRKESVEFSDLGYWESNVEKEFVAVLPDTQYLLPPRVILRLTKTPSHKVTPQQIIIEAISQETDITIQNSFDWWQAIIQLLKEDLRKGNPVEWKDFGTFTPKDDSIIFTPKGNLQTSLNYAFVDFPIVEVNPGKAFDDTKYIEVSTIEEAIDNTSVIQLSPEEPDILSEDTNSTQASSDEEEESQPIGHSVIEDAPIPDDNSSKEIDSTTEEGTTTEEENENSFDSNDRFPHTQASVVMEAQEEEKPNITTHATSDRETNYGEASPWKALLIGLFVIIAILSIIFIALQPTTSGPAKVQDTQIIKSNTTTVLDSSAIKSDSVSIKPIDSIEDNANLREINKEIVKENKPFVQQDKPKGSTPSSSTKTDINNGDKWITIQSGDNLRSIALKEYGDKSFWKYIYQANINRISDPDNVQAGTKILIPKRVSQYVKHSNDR